MSHIFPRAAAGLLAVMAGAHAVRAVVFTGDVPADFSSPATLIHLDARGDVGLPATAPPGTVSGWDLDGVWFELDLAAGRLHVGLDFRGLAGDVDGDGAEGGTSDWLAALGGWDLPDLAQSEAVVIALDGDRDGTYDLIAGVGAQDGTYRVCAFSGSPLLPAMAFGSPRPAWDGGHCRGVDVELSLVPDPAWFDAWATEPALRFLVFAGSLQDDGIGEEHASGEAWFISEGGPPLAAAEPAGPDLLEAWPNPFNPRTTLAVDLAATGHVDLALFDLRGRRLRTLARGPMAAGRHLVTLDAADLPGGTYLARLDREGRQALTRLLLLR